ncbi:MAG: AAA family ATPase [Candidatus Eisenbacteria bacterium]|uniref:endopeptidase La n=1 Tax=Eiseniibacteriota bacterium TaxID=2212470 RepID=A0A948W7R4_UNCEI|nr:AAA family ATPase [Candidatus Eisenbacteria bacterium]
MIRPEDLALKPEEVRWQCNPSTLGFSTTEELEEKKEIIGQDRAVKAVVLGLNLRSKGYNIYVAGPPGTGKTTAIRRLLQKVGKEGPTPPDICYLNNFNDPDNPTAVILPAGKGVALRRGMDDLVSQLRPNLAQIFESDRFKERTKAIVEEYKEREKTIIRSFEEKIQAENFALVQVQIGPYSKPEIAPVIAEEAVTMERLDSMTHQGQFKQEEFDRLKEKYKELASELEETLRKTRDIKKELRNELLKTQKEFASPIINDGLDDMKREFDNEKVREYLEQVREEILDNLEELTNQGEEEPKANQRGNDDKFRAYRVNVVVDNSHTKGLPAIFETSPNYRNLFGTIERVMEKPGFWSSDFTRIKTGSILRANGGCLILNLLDMIVEPGVWAALKRTLKHNKVDIQTYDPFYLVSANALKPEPIDIDVKVLMIGDSYSYNILYSMDEDFRKIFKVKAEFNSIMPREEENVHRYAGFVCTLARKEGLRQMDASGVAALVEYGVRRAGRQNKITTYFSLVADVHREANFWAGDEKVPVISGSHVEKAIQERDYRSQKIEDQLQEMMEEGTILGDTEGCKVGQVNGLSVFDLGDYAFGRPTRITTKTSVGQGGIVSIEREVDLSGRIHDKGVLILEGFFRHRFAQSKPLTLAASICFEQSYSGIDGDSASSTEIYALLSSLSGFPIRQDCAVTGSVNQHGEIQPIGGVNEKIEGFYHICKAKGLTGTQGVLIPKLNIKDLMLKEELVEVIREGRFHVYAISTIEEGIEILTGIPAGSQNPDGSWEPKTVFGEVDSTLIRYAEVMKTYSGGGGDGRSVS